MTQLCKLPQYAITGKKPIRSPAIGSKIKALHYDAESGYVVIELDSGEELWISADYEGYHILFDTPGDSSTCL